MFLRNIWGNIFWIFGYIELVRANTRIYMTIFLIVLYWKFSGEEIPRIRKVACGYVLEKYKKPMAKIHKNKKNNMQNVI